MWYRVAGIGIRKYKCGIVYIVGTGISISVVSCSWHWYKYKCGIVHRVGWYWNTVLQWLPTKTAIIADIALDYGTWA